MSEAPTLDELWQTYREDCVPPDAPTVQVLETQKAFYAGAVAMHTQALRAAKLSKKGFAYAMDQWKEQILQFARRVGGH